MRFFNVFRLFGLGWGQGFGCLNLLLLAWCGLGALIFLLFASCLVFLFFLSFLVEKLGCDDRSVLSRCLAGGLILRPFLGFKPDKLHPVVCRQFAILATCGVQQFRVRKPVCMLFGSILILLHLSLCFASDRCSQVCTGLFANPMGCPHWGWTLFARQGGVGRISLLQIADPSCWFLTTGRQWNPPGNLHIAMLAWEYSVAKFSLHQECSPFKKQ